MKTLVAFLAVVAACLANIGGLAGADDNAQQVTLPLATLTGPDSHVKVRSYHRIVSQDEWIKVWQRHQGAKESMGVDIDFKQCMVIAVFQGSGWNSRGLRAVAVQEEKSRIVLKFENESYQTMGPDGGGEQVTVYGFFVLPRFTKPVVLEENVQQYLGQPPVWKEQASLPIGPMATIAIEVSDPRQSPSHSVRKETLELPLNRPADASTLVTEVESPEHIYKITCQLTAISDTKLPPVVSTWLYEIVRDKKTHYHLLRGGLSIHNWSAAGEQDALDAALPALKADLVHRATKYREGVLRQGDRKPQ